ncbi:Spermidine synthase [Roseimaritima multifibrata]|uniref:Spermidine synthase n=1 Tax=Roseimaritima multifibrata TaxID=1930274 RepID=A0A517MFA5_9BACT|nr:fused MFS/spermidine synthase [Roseimaritima multifibrata]QDS93437.1 Spermidine synthase [Roseimaritima multifibrata]
MLPFYLIFFASGFAALVYEVSWNRQLGLLFGHTSHASAVVLAAYFGGLAIGYFVGGRWANRVCPFRGYACCEIAAGIWAFAVPTLLQWGSTTSWGSALQSSDPSVQLAARVLFSLLLLAPATIALGATLPLMNEMLQRVPSGDGRTLTKERLTRAYAFNVLGAVLGVVAASSMLLASIGVVKISWFAALISIGCGLVAVTLAGRGTKISSAEKMVPQGTEAEPVLQEHRFPMYWLLVVTVSGGGTLALEVLYTRLFTFVFHNSTYTFSFVLISFLLGISLGAFLVQRWLQSSSPYRIASWVGGMVAGLIPVSVIGFVLFTELQYFRSGDTFASYYLGGLLLVLVVTCPIAIGSGMFLPLAWSVGHPTRTIDSRTIGRLTLFNTVAAACGAIAASFLLFPTVGIWSSFAFLALLFLVPVLTNPVQFGFRWARFAMPAAVLLTCLPLVVGAPESWGGAAGKDRLVKRWHSSYGWIDVVQHPRTGVLKVQQNLHYRYGATGSNAEREFRQAHLPLFIHPNPTNALFLGLGTGMTAGGAIPHQELEAISIVELIPEVVEAAAMLGKENRRVVEDPRVQMIVDDARHYLLTSETRYDVIVADLFVPWESETGYLYTVEQFAAVKKNLRKGGLFCQWLPLYQLGSDDFQMIADSLRDQFPHVTLWWGRLNANRPILALVASMDPLRVDQAATDRRLEAMQQRGELDDTYLANAKQLVQLYAGDWPRRQGMTLNRDEHPWVEFQSPLSHRSGRLIRNQTLHDMVEFTFEPMTADSLIYKPASDRSPPVDRRWQRTVLFPAP